MTPVNFHYLKVNDFVTVNYYTARKVVKVNETSYLYKLTIFKVSRQTNVRHQVIQLHSKTKGILRRRDATIKKVNTAPFVGKMAITKKDALKELGIQNGGQAKERRRKKTTRLLGSIQVQVLWLN